MTDLSFVNIHGQPVDANNLVSVRRESKPQPASFHKGFRVEGHKPGAIEDARAKRDLEILHAKNLILAGDSGVKVPAAFNESYWMNNAKKTPVRSKPYELLSAAEVCRELAQKAGWLCVVVREIKREAKNADGH